MNELQIKICELFKKEFENEHKREPIIEKYNYGWWVQEEPCKSCKTKQCNKFKISLDEAKKMIIKGTQIHTFRDIGEAGIVGSNWKRRKLLNYMKKYDNTLQLTGKNMVEMNHKICLFDEYGVLFIETN